MAIDAELVASLNKAKSAEKSACLMYAFAQKGASGTLVINRTITGKQVAQAKEKAGGGTLFRGQCFGEEGKLIFELAKEPSATLAAAIKRAITLDAALTLNVVVRVAPEAEANGQAPPTVTDPPGTDPNAPMAKSSIPAPPRPGGEAAFKTRLSALQAELKAAGGPTPEQQMLLNQAFSAAGDKNFAAALDALKQVDGSKKTKKEEPDTLESATFKRALAELKPRFDKARVIDSGLMPRMGDILALAKSNRYADALEMLDKLEIDVDRTLASVPKPAVNGDAFKARLKALLPKYNTAIKNDAALLAQLRPLMSQVIAQGNANQFEQAMPLLIQIEKALAAASPGGKAKALADVDSCMQRLTDLKPAIKAALSAGGPNVARIQALVAAAGGLLKNKDAVQANKVLDELESLLKPTVGAGATDLAAEWKAKLAEYSPAIKQAIAAKGSNAVEIGKLLAGANALSKPGGDMAQALAALTRCHALATTGAVPKGPDAEVKKATTTPDTENATFKARVAEAKKQLDPLKAADPARAKALAGLLMQAISFGQTNAYGDAKLRLDEFDKQLAAWKAESAQKKSEKAEGEDAPDTEPKTPTARWEAERNKILPKLLNEIKEVVATKHPKAGKAELELKVVLRQLKAEMVTKQQAAEMERYLKDDDVVAAVCKMTFDLKTPLLKVLADIKDQLSA